MLRALSFRAASSWSAILTHVSPQRRRASLATRKKTRSLEQIQSEIARLEKEAKAIRDAEVGEVVAKMKAAIKHYGLTAADLGLAPRAGAMAPKATTKAGKRGAPKGKASKTARPVKYRDDAGNRWVGHGKRPKWFVDALAAGKTAEDLLVK
jgi:DNA-binding protein H-NS